ncbi:SLAM family member 8-like isoform X2 [Polyodon spathula]|uniref:SLAM family member 8-like isoform X2 n=1 Tax=Polyodon spathula TaxID=7913 RepID=UPI001B7E13AB|nr:SLAM family member 8-like isoform X2 [Polyodon spathula]
MSTHRRSLYFNYALSVCIALPGLLADSSLSPGPGVNGTVGESVVLPAGLSQQSNIDVEWRWGGKTIALSSSDLSTEFGDRLHLNRTDWSLTINRLRAEDTGEYSRVAIIATGQLPTRMITLHVYEKISSEVRRTPSNETCSATLLCTANQTKHVSYRWKRGDQDLPEHAGKLEVSLSAGETGVIFTCIASNPVSEAAASIRESCENSTMRWLSDWRIYSGIAGALLLLLLICVVVLWQKKKKKHDKAVEQTSQHQTVYAEIQRKSTQRNHVEKSSRAQQSDSLPMTVYETVNLRQAPGKSCKIVKFNQNEERSPYQQIL